MANVILVPAADYRTTSLMRRAGISGLCRNRRDGSYQARERGRRTDRSGKPMIINAFSQALPLCRPGLRLTIPADPRGFVPESRM